MKSCNLMVGIGMENSMDVNFLLRKRYGKVRVPHQLSKVIAEPIVGTTQFGASKLKFARVQRGTDKNQMPPRKINSTDCLRDCSLLAILTDVDDSEAARRDRRRRHDEWLSFLRDMGGRNWSFEPVTD
jgi:hypothetical protein